MIYRNIIAGVFLVLCLLLGMVAAQENPAPVPPVGTVTRNANLRAGPSLQKEVIGYAPAGAKLTILDEEEDWYRIRTSRGLIAWIHKSLLEPLPLPQPVPAAESPSPQAPSTTSQFTSPVSAVPSTIAREPIPPAPPVPKEEQAEGRDEPQSEGKGSPPSEGQTASPPPGQPAAATAPGPVPFSFAPSALPSFYFSADHIFLLLLLILIVLLLLLFLQYRILRALRRLTLSLTPLSAPPGEDSQQIPEDLTAMLSPVEQAIVTLLHEKGEMTEEALIEQLSEQGLTPDRLKAAVVEIIGKTESQHLPLIQIRYANGNYFYSLHPTLASA